jgi:hypothetical protein
VFSIGTIESKLIGTAANGGASGSSNTGDSHRRVRRFPSVFDIIGFFHGGDTAWDYETKQAGITGGNAEVEDLGPCKTKVSFTAAASYPFGPYGFDSLHGLTPNINYSVTFTFEVTAKNQVTVTLTGSHNSFPDYEGYADGNNFYKYSSSWGGPNPINLGMTWRNIPSGTKHVINNIEVPDCCPGSSK